MVHKGRISASPEKEGTVSMLTVREVSRLLHVHSSTLRRWSDRGVLRAHRTGPRGERRFKPGDIAVFLLEEDRGFQLNLGLKVGSTKRKSGNANTAPAFGDLFDAVPVESRLAKVGCRK